MDVDPGIEDRGGGAGEVRAEQEVGQIQERTAELRAKAANEDAVVVVEADVVRHGVVTQEPARVELQQPTHLHEGGFVEAPQKEPLLVRVDDGRFLLLPGQLLLQQLQLAFGDPRSLVSLLQLV